MNQPKNKTAGSNIDVRGSGFIGKRKRSLVGLPVARDNDNKVIGKVLTHDMKTGRITFVIDKPEDCPVVEALKCQNPN